MVQNCPLILFSTRFQDVVQEDGRFECGDGNGGNAKTDDEKENNRTGETRSEERGQANREEAKRRRGRGQRTSELKERKRTGENRRETGSRKGRQALYYHLPQHSRAQISDRNNHLSRKFRWH
ncbi:uncharacterized protein LOC143358156 isoform X2 [Halictus rubicundus]|uniref:uncharacterized protein LOC143358156 isoform X2 n=1 Tax=Halictus rubicundus TaxID=77578 RepID=UPI004035F382